MASAAEAAAAAEEDEDDEEEDAAGTAGAHRLGTPPPHRWPSRHLGRQLERKSTILEGCRTGRGSQDQWTCRIGQTKCDSLGCFLFPPIYLGPQVRRAERLIALLPL